MGDVHSPKQEVLQSGETINIVNLPGSSHLLVLYDFVQTTCVFSVALQVNCN